VLEPESIIRLEDDRVVLLDQRRLPDEEVELACGSAVEVAEAIRALAVRGAPAIGIAAAYGYALAAARGDDLDAAAVVLAAARPTAVNLEWALREVRAAGDPATRARALHAEEVERCRRMSEHAAGLFGEGSRALTHCNTGALATGGVGTALGALREAWARGLVRHVFVDETRPLLQGARLTVWELARLGIDHALLVDAAAPGLLRTGAAHAVVTGFDRVAANGDVANKVGTYGLALASHAAGVPFMAAGPSSSIDLRLASGEDIEIEERDADEVRAAGGALLTVEGTACRNPAFDVTPAELVWALVTERGAASPVTAETVARVA
jgi:methylthioribose-1-phosphate isomerase